MLAHKANDASIKTAAINIFTAFYFNSRKNVAFVWRAVLRTEDAKVVFIVFRRFPLRPSAVRPPSLPRSLDLSTSTPVASLDRSARFFRQVAVGKRRPRHDYH